MSKEINTQSEYLHYGCIVALSFNENEYTHSSGFIDSSIYLSPYSEITDFSQCLFRVLPFSIHSIQCDLLSTLENSDLFEYQKKYIESEEKLRAEFQNSLDNYEKFKGQPLHFGAIVYLQHVLSHKFLTVFPNEISIFDRDCLKITLTDFPNDYSYIKLQPSYNFQKERHGLIRKSDIIVLEVYLPSLSKNSYVTVSDNTINPTQAEVLTREVAACMDKKCKWQLNMYYSVNLKNANLLQCGDFIWISHSEGQAVLVAMCKDNHVLVYFNNNLTNSNGLWRIEREVNTVGGFVYTEQNYRLKHLATGMYLALEKNSEGKYAGTLASKDHENNLWVFQQIYSNNKKAKIFSDQFCSLMNKTTKVKLQGLESGDQFTNIHIGFSHDSSETSYFKIFRADFNTSWESQFTLSCIPILSSLKTITSQYNKELNGDAYTNIKEFRKNMVLAQSCLTQISLFLQSKQSNSMTLGKSYGVIDKARQKSIKELGIIDILADFLDNAFVEEFSLNKVLKLDASTHERVSSFSQRIKVDLHKNIHNILLKEIVIIVQQIYELLSISCKENLENQLYTFKFLDVFQKHAGYDLGATKFMSMILSDNETLLFKLLRNNSVSGSSSKISIIDHYVWLLKKFAKERKSHLVEFLKTICSCGDFGVSINQEKLHEILFFNPESYNKVILPTSLDSERKNLFVILQHPSGIGEESISLFSCFSYGSVVKYQKEIEYFTVFLGLFSSLCKGRNYICKASVNNWFPFRIIFDNIWNEELTIEVRANFLEMLMNMHIDFQPRSFTEKPELIRTLEKGDPSAIRINFSRKHSVLNLDSGLDLVRNVGEKLTTRRVVGRENPMFSRRNQKQDEFSFLINEDEQDLFNLKCDLIRYFEEIASPDFNIFTLELFRLSNMLIKFEVISLEKSVQEMNRCVFSSGSAEFNTNDTDIFKLMKALFRLLFYTEARKSVVMRSLKTQMLEPVKMNSAMYRKKNMGKAPYNDLSEEPFAKYMHGLQKFMQFNMLRDENDSNTETMEIKCKLVLCDAVSFALKLRQDYLLNNILAWYKQDENKELEDPTILIPELISLKLKQNPKKRKKHFKYFHKPVFKQLTVICPNIVDELFKLIVGTTNYELRTKVISIILQLFSERKEMIKSLRKVKIMAMESDPEIFLWAKISMGTFRNLAEQSEIICKYWTQNDKMHDKTLEKLDTLTALLTNFEVLMHADCRLKSGELVRQKPEIDFDRQIMLKHLNFHTYVISLIKDGIYILEEIFDNPKSHKEIEAKNKLFLLFSLCYKALLSFTYKNSKNQKALYSYLNILTINLRIQVGQIDLICEIFRDNASLCTLASEAFLQQFIDLIINEGRQEMFLKFFEVVTEVDGVGIPNIQRLILMLMCQNNVYHKVCYMDENDRFEFKESEEPNSDSYIDQPFLYHARLINVLTKCGKHSTGFQLTKAKCQKILSFDMVLELLSKGSEHKILEVPLLNFLITIYLSSNIIEDLANTAELFRLIEIKSGELKEITEIADVNLESIEKLVEIMHDFYTKSLNQELHKVNYAFSCIENYLKILSDNWTKLQQLKINSEFQKNLDNLGEAFNMEFSRLYHTTDIVLNEISCIPNEKTKWNKVVGQFNQNNCKAYIKKEQTKFLKAMNSIKASEAGVSRKEIIEAFVEYISLANVYKPPSDVLYTLIKFLANSLDCPDKIEKDQAEYKRRAQEELRELRIVNIILELMCDKSLEKSIFSILIHFSIKLLDGGNEKVQQDFFNFFTTFPISENFFCRIYSMINDFISFLTMFNENDPKTKVAMRKSSKIINNLIKLLQLLCENHFEPLQNYIQIQGKSRNNYDLVTAVISLLQELMARKKLQSFEIIKHCFEMLTEAIQGPCLMNQKAIITSKFLDIASDLLGLDHNTEDLIHYLSGKGEKSQHRGLYAYLESDMVIHLKYKCLITLLGLLEGRNDNFNLIRMARAFNLLIFRKNIISIYERFLNYRSAYNKNIFLHVNESQYSSVEKKLHNSLFIEVGFFAFFLMKYFISVEDGEIDKMLMADVPEFVKKHKETHERVNRATVESSQTPQKQKNMVFSINLIDTDSDMFCRALDFFEKNTGNVEIVFQGVSSITYFWLPPVCHHLTFEVKEEFTFKIDRTSDKKKVESLIANVPEVIEDMQYEEKLSTAYGYKFMTNNVRHLKNLGFALTIWLNLVILFSYSSYGTDRLDEPSYLNVEPGSRKTNKITSTKMHIKGVGTIHCILSGVIFLYFIIKIAPILVQRVWKEQAAQVQDPQNANKFTSKAKKYLLTFLYTLSSIDVLFYFLYFAFSILGLTVHPFFFSAHLADAMYRFPSLQNVVKAIYIPWKSLVLTLVFILVIVYLFSVWAYVRLSEHFVGNCDSLLLCFATVFDKGFKNSGGIGMWLDLVYPPTSGEVHIERFFFDNLFTIILLWIMMNIIQGIIIVTFAVVREIDASNLADINNKCLICGKEKEEIERSSGKTFKYHRETVHNEWNYVFFLTYLEFKENTEHTGIESYVYQQNKNKCIDWVPLEQGMGFTENEEVE